MSDITIINVDENNISKYEPTCFLNPKNEGYLIKLEWLKKRFSEGMKIKQLYLEKEGKCNGFIEYVPGEYAWRAVDAETAQNAPSIYASFNLVYNGKLLANHYISSKRFLNIINKEIK